MAPGRRRDFLTSPEVGPLFGTVVARALDTWWLELGAPDPFVVVDAGAGPGTLARSVLAAEPDCAPVMRYVAVDVSAPARALHPETVESRPDLPPGPLVGVVLANELLDNIPFDISEDHVPLLDGARRWVEDALGRLQAGRVVAFDYGVETTQELVGRQWLRTYRGHERGFDPYDAPGTRDITTEIAIDQLPPPTRVSRQADWLQHHSIDELVQEGRTLWNASAGAPDLAAVRARSRIQEAAALTDPQGLGAFWVLEWQAEPGH